MGGLLLTNSQSCELCLNFEATVLPLVLERYTDIVLRSRSICFGRARKNTRIPALMNWKRRAISPASVMMRSGQVSAMLWENARLHRGLDRYAIYIVAFYTIVSEA